MSTAKVIMKSDQHIVRTTKTENCAFCLYFEGLRGSSVCNTACVVSRLTVSSKRRREPTPVRPRRGGPHGSLRLVFSASDCPHVWFQLNGRIRLSQSRGRSTGGECASGEPERDFSFGGESGSRCQRGTEPSRRRRLSVCVSCCCGCR